jgi:ATP-dependent Clp protease protease subunit
MADDYEKSLPQLLRESRIVYLSGEITTPSAESVVTQLFALDALDHTAEIKLYISSYGGSVYAGLAIYDAMQIVEAPVSTLCIGAAFSMAAWLLAAGEPGQRSATRHSRIMLHQASAGVMGTSSDIKVAAENVLQCERLMTDLLARHVGRPAEDVGRAIERDLWLTAEQALAFGLIDRIAQPCSRKTAAPIPR